MTDVTTLYLRYGSRITTGVSELFYDRVYADPSLAPFFAGIEINRMQEHMSDVLSVLTGGPDLYKGRDLAVAHTPYGITDADFDKLMAHMRAAIEKIGASAAEAEAMVEAMSEERPNIVSA